MEWIKEPDAFEYLFEIPEGFEEKTFTIYFWDKTADDGKGDWIALPTYQEEDGKPVKKTLHPEEDDELRIIYSGVEVMDDYRLIFSTNFPGLFVLTY